MKRALLGTIVFVMILTSSAFAYEKKYGAAGCGLGSMLIGDEPGMIQVLAAIVNNAIVPQTFGISSGTMNCEKQAKFSSNEKLNQFVVANIDNLAKDVAMGQGESLETLAEIMGIPAIERTVIYSKLQANFSSIFTSEKVEAANVIDNIITVING